MPAWLNEGLAMYFEPEGRHNSSLVAGAVRSGDAPPLRYMHSIPGQPREVTLFYAQARNVVTFLIDELGQARMSTLLLELKSGSDIGEAVLVAYGIELDELDERWRAWLTGGPSPPLDAPYEPEAGVDPQTVTLEAYGASDVYELASEVPAEVAAPAERPEPDVGARPAQVAEGRAWWPFAAGASALATGVLFAAVWRLRRA